MGALAAIAFFLSGASSLIFQSIWTRMLQHVFGSSSVAQSSVLCVFMGGLGLGAWLFGKYADRIRRPLLVYALAELGVALLGLLIPLLVHPEGWLADVNAALRSSLGAESPAFLAVRFLCIVPILIVPTTLMGSTLPLLARHFVALEAQRGRTTTWVGALYAVNTLGAVAGTFLGGFVLLPAIGRAATNLTACAMNLLLAAMIGVLLFAPRRPAPPSAPPAGAPAADAVPDRIRRLALAAFAISGAVALCYEVVWTRALAMTLGSSIYSFTLILMTFLIGIALGSAAIARTLGRERAPTGVIAGAAMALTLLADFPLGLASGALAYTGVSAAALALAAAVWLAVRRRGGALVLLAIPTGAALLNAFLFEGDLPKIVASVVASIAAFLALTVLLRRRHTLLLGAIPVFIAAATVVGYLWQDRVPHAFGGLIYAINQSGEDVLAVQLAMFLIAGLSVLPATLGMGAMFPLTLRAWSSGGARVGRDVSVVYSVNTVGSLVGAWLPGFLLLPTIGMEGTLQAGIGANLLLGVALLLCSVPRRVLALAAPLVALAAGAAFLASSPRWDRRLMTLGYFRVESLPFLLGSAPKTQLVYYRDGVSTTVSVERAGPDLVLRNNGKPDASTGEMPTQINLGVFPLLLHPRVETPLDVAVIGFGSGVTVGSALQFPVRHVDVIELERAVVEASRFFAPVNNLSYTRDDYPYVSSPRLTVVNDDGRNYLAGTARTYDVIISEPSNPWISGVSELFTADHFRIARKRLRPGGIFCQWVQLYELSPESIKSILRTFASEFPHVLVLSVEARSVDTMILGSNEPFRLDLAHLAKGYALPGIAAELRRASMPRIHDLFARVLLANKEEVMRYSELEHRLEGGRWVARFDSVNDGECPRASCRREPAPLNTDDNSLLELRAPRDLIGSPRFADHSSRVLYGASWPYGRFSGSFPAEERAALALSMLAHGRKAEAGSILEALEKPPADARLAYAYLTDRAPAPALRVEVPDAGLPIRALIEAREFDAALKLFDEIEPVAALLKKSPEMMLLAGYVLFKAAELGRVQHRLAIWYFDELETKHPALRAAYPESDYYHARALDAAGRHGRALERMLAYIAATSRTPPRP